MTTPLDRKLRVMHVIGQLIPGGVELRTLELIQETAPLGIEHHVCLVSGKAGDLDAAYRKAGASLYYHRIASPLFPIALIRELRSRKIDVVHSTIAAASGLPLAAARIAGVPNRVWHLRTDGDESGASLSRRLKVHLLRTLAIWGATEIAGLTPMNLALAYKRDWQEDARTSVLPNGVRVSSRAENSAMLREFDHDIKILHVGRGEIPTKNRDKAIRILSHVIKANSNARIFFVGRDGLDIETSQRNRSLWEGLALDEGVSDRVHFLGERDDVQELMRSGSALLMTSSLEGLPGVVLEALANGLPVLSSDVPGSMFIAESVDGIEILPVEADDKVWAARMSDYAAEVSRETRERIQSSMRNSQFNLDTAAQRYIALWAK